MSEKTPDANSEGRPDDTTASGAYEEEAADVGRGALAATLGTAASRVTGFLRIMVTVFTIGVVENKLADTYHIANDTPTQLYELAVGGVLSALFIRAYIQVRDTEGQEEAWRFVTRVMKLSLLILVAFVVVGLLAAPLVMKLYTFRSTAPTVAAQQAVGTLMFRLMVPQLVFYGFSTISVAVLNSHHRVGVFSFAPVLNNLTVIATMGAFAVMVPASSRGLDRVPRQGLWLLGLGTTAGVALLGLTPWFWMRRLGFHFVRGAGWRDPRLAAIGRLSAHLLGYVAINQLGVVVATYLANKIQGGAAGYKNAFQFFQLPHGLFAVSIAVVVRAGLAESDVASDLGRFAARLSRGLRGIAFVVIPAAAAYVAIAPEIVRLLLEHGIATPSTTRMVGTVLRAWAPGIVFFSFWALLLQAFYQRQDTRTPMLINLVAFAVNVVVDIALFNLFTTPDMKIAGLALGHAASYLVAASIGIAVMRRRVGGRAAERLGATAARATAAAALAGTVMWGTMEIIGRRDAMFPSQLLSVTLAGGFGLLIYFAVTKLLRMEELAWISNVARRRSR